MKKLYNPHRDRRDADLCEQMVDGSVRDAAGRLIYMPTSNVGAWSGGGGDHPDRIPTDHTVFEDQTWNEYADERRLSNPEVHYPASLEGIKAWLETQGVF